MRAGTCPSPAELSRAFLEGAEPSLQAHLELCSSCTTEWRKLAELRTLTQKLPAAIPDAAHRGVVRAQMLAKLAPSRPRAAVRMVPARWLWASGAAAVAACLLALLRLWPGDHAAAANFRATVQTQSAAARFVHERSGGDERVRLSSGHLLIEVAPLHKGERFRVLCQDAEVEVRGTAFELEVVSDHLLDVRVLHGRVEVRPSGGRSLLLGAGERWTASAPAGAVAAVPAATPLAVSPAVVARAAPEAQTPPATPVAPPGPAAPPTSAAMSVTPEAHAAPRRTASRANVSNQAAPDRTQLAGAAKKVPVRAAAPSLLPKLSEPPAERSRVARTPEMSAAERAFDDGWVAMQRGEFGEAAKAFGLIESSVGSDSLLEDARFWRAVALGRAGQSQAEAVALNRFLSFHPSSSRAGEAAAILGWLLVKQGRLDEAKQRFQAAALDGRDDVRQSALAGLASIAARRPTASDSPGR